jgi:hypothetical protein
MESAGPNPFKATTPPNPIRAKPKAIGRPAMTSIRRITIPITKIRRGDIYTSPLT